MESYFKQDTYDTPENLRRDLGDRLFLNTRLWFYIHHLRIIFSYRSLALKKKDTPELWVDHCIRIFKLIERCGGRFHMTGFDNLRKVKEPLVVVSNHMGTLETQVFPGIFYPFFPVTFIVKEALVKHSVFGPIMRSTKPIAVGRVNAKQDFITVLAEGQKILAQGTSIIVFPESTRRLKFIPINFNSLGVKLARKAGVKVLPVAIKTDFWKEGKYLNDLGPLDRSKPIYMAFGEALSITGNGKEQHQQCIDFIQSHLDTWEK